MEVVKRLLWSNIMEKEKIESEEMSQWVPGSPSRRVKRKNKVRRVSRLDFLDLSASSEDGAPGKVKKKKIVPVQPIEQEPEEKAYFLGKEEGVRIGSSQVEPHIQRLQSLFQSVAAAREELVRKSEQEIVELAMMIARKVVHRELETKQEGILEITKAAIEKLLDRERLEIRIHPSDHEFLTQEKERLLQEVEGIKNLVITADASIAPGGCVISTALGEVDARIDHQLKEVERVLRED